MATVMLVDACKDSLPDKLLAVNLSKAANEVAGDESHRTPVIFQARRPTHVASLLLIGNDVDQVSIRTSNFVGHDGNLLRLDKGESGT